jgi:uroporphyrinogen-III synthase
MTPLQGIGVLVTRPEMQAMPLCRLLEAQGAATYRLPAIDIKPFGDRRALSARLGDLGAFDLIIFVSANAVRFGASLLDQKRNLELAAIGPATARALNLAGYRVTITPPAGFDSESLLAHATLKNPAGMRILLVKGSDGRELLADELQRRGASIEAVEVYRRERAAPGPAALASLEQQFTAGEIQVITATSLDIAESLLGLATPALRREFNRVQWLVPSARIVEGVGRLGLRAPLLLATSPEDQDLLAALLRWRASVSGA